MIEKTNPQRIRLFFVLLILIVVGFIPQLINAETKQDPTEVRATAAVAPTFTLSWLEPVGEHLNTDAEWGDFDGDGRLDLAIANYGEFTPGSGFTPSKNQLFLNKESGMELIWESDKDENTTSIAWGDFDNDGDLDLAEANDSDTSPPQPSRILINENGTLVEDSDLYFPINRSQEIAWGDYDADGDLDIAIANVGSPNQIYENTYNQNGQFTLAWESPDIGESLSLAWGDADQDGQLDLFIGNWDRPNQLYRGNNGTFDLVWETPASPSNTYTTVSVAWGDYDNDGFPDIGIANYLSDDRLYRNLGDNTFDLAWGESEVVEFGCSTPNVQTQDLAVITDTITIDPGDTQTLQDLDVQFNLLHSWVGDLTITLTHEDTGTSALLIDRPGYIDTGFGCGDDNILGIADDAGFITSIEDYCPGTPNWINPSETFVPQEPLAVFNGEELAGTWTLSVQDSQDGDNGTLVEWCLLPDETLPRARPLSNYFGNQGLATSSSVSTKKSDSGFSIERNLLYPNIDLAWGDIDNDKDLDMLFSNVGDVIDIYENNGAGFGNERDGFINLPDKGTLAFGDWDNDGDLDLVAGSNEPNAFGSEKLSISENEGDTTFKLEWLQSTPENQQSNSQAIALGDFDGNGGQDFVIGTGLPNVSPLFKIDNGLTIVNQFGEGESTYTVAWADVDNDGDLDLSLGNYGSNDYVFRNDNGVISNTPIWDSARVDFTTKMAWADWDRDGDLDLALGLSSFGGGTAANQLYENNGFNTSGMLQLDLIWISPTQEGTTDLVWGDWDSDGDPDLLVGNLLAPNQVYENTGDDLVLAWEAEDTFLTESVDWADWDKDGDLDIAVGNRTQRNRVYEYDSLAKTFNLAWQSNSSDYTTAIAWGDFDGDGDPDLAEGNFSFTNALVNSRIYENNERLGLRSLDSMWDSANFFVPFSTANGLAWGDPLNSGRQGLFIADENFSQFYENVISAEYASISFAQIKNPSGQGVSLPYGTSVILEDDLITIDYELVSQNDTVVPFIETYYSLDDGVTWQTATVAPSSTTTDLTATITGTAHTLDWDVSADGILGLRDTVRFRIDTIAPSAQSDLLPSPFVKRTNTSTNFRVRSAQIKVVDDNGDPVPNAIVLKSDGGVGQFEPFSDVTGEPFVTSSAGTLQGFGAVNEGDQLVALIAVTDQPEIDGYTLYYTSADPTDDGVSAATFTGDGIQTLVVSSTNPLYIFDLDVSLEWDSRQDQAYLQQLEADLGRASEILYDLTDGQAILGEITVNQNRDEWNFSDLVIHASNNIRPSALAGGVLSPGITVSDVISGSVKENVYVPGQIRMGPTWNRYGQPAETIGEDWSTTLAHELGHYLFYLPDNYLGINNNLITFTDCQGSIMTDPYIDTYSEFLYQSNWGGECLETLAEFYLGRDDWETITKFYPDMIPPSQDNPALQGPNNQPIALTNVTILDPTNAPTSLADPEFRIQELGGAASQLPTGRSSAYLIKTGGDDDPTNDYVQPLGAPVNGDTIEARGVDTNDRICVYDYSRENLFLGCRVVESVPLPITLIKAEDWKPQIQVTEVTSTTFDITVTNVIESDLVVQLIPTFGASSPTKTITATNGVLTTTIELDDPAFAGYVRVYAPNQAGTRETIVDFISIQDWQGRALGWGGRALGWGGRALGWGGRALGWGAPSLSSDGQVAVFPDDPFTNDTVFNLQTLPFTPELDSWLTAVGTAYRLTSDQDGEQPASILFRYLGRDVAEFETSLTVYYSPDEGVSWQALPTKLDLDLNHAVVAGNDAGIYVLTISNLLEELAQGWNPVFNYTGPEQEVSLNLDSIDGKYTSVYEVDLANPGDWPFYDADVALEFVELVNTLDTFTQDEDYWIYALEAVTWFVDTELREMQQSYTFPPATYYGYLIPTGNFMPEVGMSVKTYINDTLCGETETVALNGQVAYVIQTQAEDQLSPNNCGNTNRDIQFVIDDTENSCIVPWSNIRATRVDLANCAVTSVEMSKAQSASSGFMVLFLIAFSGLLTFVTIRMLRRSGGRLS